MLNKNMTFKTQYAVLRTKKRNPFKMVVMSQITSCTPKKAHLRLHPLMPEKIKRKMQEKREKNEL